MDNKTIRANAWITCYAATFSTLVMDHNIRTNAYYILQEEYDVFAKKAAAIADEAAMRAGRNIPAELKED